MTTDLPTLPPDRPTVEVRTYSEGAQLALALPHPHAVITRRPGMARCIISTHATRSGADATADEVRAVITAAHDAGRSSAPIQGAVYAVAATVAGRDSEGWSSARQVPTFYLAATAQGIVSAEHAERIAVDIIDPSGALRVAGTVITATPYPI